MEEIKTMMVIEMLGRPKEHIEKTMEEFIKRLGEEKGVLVTNKKIHEPKTIENKNEKGEIIKIESGKEIFSTFAEIDVTFKNLFNLIRITFNYMPSHIEVISPEEFRLQNFDLSSILTEITGKMHQYDAIAKNALLQNNALATKLTQMYELFKQKGIEDKELVFKTINSENTKDIKPKRKSKKKKEEL